MSIIMSEEVFLKLQEIGAFSENADRVSRLIIDLKANHPVRYYVEKLGDKEFGEAIISSGLEEVLKTLG